MLEATEDAREILQVDAELSSHPLLAERARRMFSIESGLIS
jgi:hypothetical protein